MAATIQTEITQTCACCQESYSANQDTACIKACPECWAALISITNGIITRVSEVPAKTMAAINRIASA